MREKKAPARLSTLAQQIEAVSPSLRNKLKLRGSVIAKL